MNSRDLNHGLQACVAGTLTTEPSSQPFNLIFFEHSGLLSLQWDLHYEPFIIKVSDTH